MPSVYILFSQTKNGFYIGATETEITLRLDKHLNEYYGSAFTSNVKDWEVFLSIECSSM